MRLFYLTFEPNERQRLFPLCRIQVSMLLEQEQMRLTQYTDPSKLVCIYVVPAVVVPGSSSGSSAARSICHTNLPPLE
jgi:hypothetical protein